MSVYHFTLHAYRSWRPDHPRGYAKKGDGYLPTDLNAADKYDERANQEGVIFNRTIQILIAVFTDDICKSKDWEFEAMGSDPSHVHIMVSWRKFQTWEEVDQRLKNLLVLKLNRHFKSPGKRWFVRRHGAPRRVKDRSHYAYLIKTYFPDHRGVFWKKRDPLPKLSP